MAEQVETPQPGVVIEMDHHVAVVRLNRPDRRNAIDDASARQLTEFFTGATSDKAVRAILVTGTGRDFCSGADAVRGVSPAPASALDYRYLTEGYRSLFRSMWEVEKPMISAVNGTVAGAGWMFALLADLVVADANARWTHVFSRRAMVPHAGDPFFLPRIIPFHRLNEIALLSDTLTSADLHGWGVVNRSVEAEAVFSTAMELAQRLAAGPTRTLGLTKRLYRRSLSNDIDTCFEEERNATALISTTADRREGVQSFIEGRSPNFIGD